MTARLDDLSALFSALAPIQKAVFLSWVAHAEAAQRGGAREPIPASGRNVVVDCICRYIVEVLNQATGRDQDRLVMTMIIRSAERRRQPAVDDIWTWLRQSQRV